jgi:hypothetical protein
LIYEAMLTLAYRVSCQMAFQTLSLPFSSPHKCLLMPPSHRRHFRFIFAQEHEYVIYMREEAARFRRSPAAMVPPTLSSCHVIT